MGKSFLVFYSKEDTAIALVFLLYDGSWTNNLLVVILFQNWAMHIFKDKKNQFFLNFRLNLAIPR